MHSFKHIQFPSSDNNHVFDSMGVSDTALQVLFTKFMEAARAGEAKSRVIKNIMAKNEFTDDDMKLIMLLAYDRAVEHIQKTAEKEFSSGQPT